MLRGVPLLNSIHGMRCARSRARASIGAEMSSTEHLAGGAHALGELERAGSAPAAEIDDTLAFARLGSLERKRVDRSERTVKTLLLRHPALGRGSVPKFDSCG